MGTRAPTPSSTSSSCPTSTYWEDIQSRVTDYGESIILQTCCGDNAHYRVVIAV